MAWNFEYGGAVPPLPKAADLTGSGGTSLAATSDLLDVLPRGCWQILLVPRFPLWIESEFHPGLHYEGTLRIQWKETEGVYELFGSGDLYVVRRGEWWMPDHPPAVEFELEDEIPIFPRGDYRYYLRLQRLAVTSTIELEIELVRFGQDPAWSPDATLIATLSRNGEGAILVGEVSNTEQGEVVADLTIGRVSPFLRRASIEMDKVKSVDAFPLDNGFGEDWPSVFKKAEWLMDVRPSDTDRDDLGKPWDEAELHAHMLRWRDATEAVLDREWLYHLLCVNQIDSQGYLTFGMMYDRNSDLGNQSPREGAAIAGHAVVPRNSRWPEKYQGRKIMDIPEIYFRTAVHEIGHAMGLYHNHNNFGIMQTTSKLAHLLPDKVDWSFSPEDVRRLCHFPDPWVRPGGLPWEFEYPFGPVPVTDLTVEPEDLKLEVVALDERLPFGAPLRVCLALRNTGSRCLPVPPEISFKSSRLGGRVIGPFGGSHPISTLARYLKFDDFRDLGPGQALYRSETLLRGQRGFLFTAPGVYRIEIEVGWDYPRGRIKVTGGTEVVVLPPSSANHAATAREIAATPQLMIPLVFGAGSEQVDRLLEKALRSAVLRPHFAMIRARLDIAAGDLRRAARCIDAESRLSATEIEGLLAQVDGAPPEVRDHRDVRRLLKALRRRWRDLRRRHVPVDPEVDRRVRRQLDEGRERR